MDWIFDSFLRFAKNVSAINDAVQQQFEKKASDIFQGIFSYEERLVQNIENAQPSRWKQLIMEGAHKNAFPFELKSNCILITVADLTKFLRKVLQDPALQEQKILRELRKENLLLMDKSGKSTKKDKGVRKLHIIIAD